MEQKFQSAKSYNFQQDLHIDAYVDAKDTVNHWCVGQISDVDEEKNAVKLHFEGWTMRYDEVGIFGFLTRNTLIVDEEEFLEVGSIQETH